MALHSGDAPEPGAGIVLDALKAMRRAPRIGHEFGGYVLARNQALLENEIGLGEYTWIYVIAYFAYIGERPVGILARPADSGIYATRVFGEVEAMMRRHVEQAEPPTGEQPNRIDPWRLELDALAANPGRVPFEDGLPTELTESIEAFRSELEDVTCPAASELDAVRTERRGLGYDHN